MTRVRREVVDEFYNALRARDVAVLSRLIDDDISWSINGPVDLLPFCGERHGKAAVLDVIINQVPRVLPQREFIPEIKLVDGDRAAILGRLQGVYYLDNRTINYRITHFLRFKNDRLIEYLSLLDSFDAAEQFLGHRLDSAHDAPLMETDAVVSL